MKARVLSNSCGNPYILGYRLYTIQLPQTASLPHHSQHSEATSTIAVTPSEKILSSTWTIAQGTVADHTLTISNPQGITAIFKQPHESSPLRLIELENELVCYELAKVLDIPTTPTGLLCLEGRMGLVSVIQSTLNFSSLSSSNVTITPAIRHDFAGLAALDWLVANGDRNTGRPDHMYLVTEGESLTFYPIDFGEALTTRSGNRYTMTNYTDDAPFPTSQFSHVVEPLINDYTTMVPTISRIESLPDLFFASIIDNTKEKLSEGCLQEEAEALRSNSEVVKKLLPARRDRARTALRDWCRVKGIPDGTELITS